MIPPEVLQKALNNDALAARMGKVESGLRDVESRVVGAEGGADALTRFRSTPVLPDLRLPPQGFPWERMTNGFRIDGTIVTIIEPEWQFSDAAAVSITNQNVTISADYQYVWAELNLTSMALSIGQDVTKPSNDDTHLRRWLYQFRLINSVYVFMYRFNGGIYTPAAYGDTI